MEQSLQLQQNRGLRESTTEGETEGEGGDTRSNFVIRNWQIHKLSNWPDIFDFRWPYPISAGRAIKREEDEEEGEGGRGGGSREEGTMRSVENETQRERKPQAANNRRQQSALGTRSWVLESGHFVLGTATLCPVLTAFVAVASRHLGAH